MIVISGLGFLIIGLAALFFGRADQKGKTTIWVKDRTSKTVGWLCIIAAAGCFTLYHIYGN